MSYRGKNILKIFWQIAHHLCCRVSDHSQRQRASGSKGGRHNLEIDCLDLKLFVCWGLFVLIRNIEEEWDRMLMCS